METWAAVLAAEGLEQSGGRTAALGMHWYHLTIPTHITGTNSFGPNLPQCIYTTAISTITTTRHHRHHHPPSLHKSGLAGGRAGGRSGGHRFELYCIALLLFLLLLLLLLLRLFLLLVLFILF